MNDEETLALFVRKNPEIAGAVQEGRHLSNNMKAAILRFRKLYGFPSWADNWDSAHAAILSHIKPP